MIIYVQKVIRFAVYTNRTGHLFFDFDDTLYDTHGNSVIALRKLYEEKPLDKIMPPFEVFNKAYVETNVEVWTKYTNGEIDRDTLIVERFRKPVTEMIKAKGGDASWVTPEACLAMSDRYGDIISLEPGIVDGAEELVKELTRKGYRLHFCSNGFHEVQYRKLKSSGLEKYNSTVILSEDVGANKPRKEFFDYAFEYCPVVSNVSNKKCTVKDRRPLVLARTVKLAGEGQAYALPRPLQGYSDVSQKMLTATLRELEADDLVVRKVYPEIPPRVEYYLTERGLSLIPLLNQLVDWSLNNFNDILSSRKKYARKAKA